MVPGNWNQINVIKEEVSKLRRKGGTVSGSTGKLTYRLEGEKLVGQLESFLTIWKRKRVSGVTGKFSYSLEGEEQYKLTIHRHATP